MFYMVAAVPVIALAILLGGVGGGEYARMILMLLVLLWASLCLGMLASTWTTDAKRASGWAFGLVALMGSLFPLLAGLVGAWDGLAEWIQRQGMERSDAVRHLSALSPATAWFSGFESQYRTHPMDFWKGVIFTGMTGSAGLVWASMRLPRLWQDKGVEGVRRGLLGWIERKIWPDAEARNGRRTRLLERSPLVWLLGRHWMRPVTIWLFLGLEAVAFVWVGLRVVSDWFDGATYMTVSILTHLVLKMWIASEAPRQFLEDRRSGGIELLMSTPMTVTEILDGQMKAMRWLFQGPVLVVLAVDCVFMWADSFSGEGSGAEWLLVMFSRMILLVLDGLAMVWLGMEDGMRSTGNRASRSILLKVLVLPWVIVIAVMTVFAASSLNRLGGPDGGIGFGGGVILWLMLGVGNAMGWMSLARSRLLAGFREYGTTRPGEGKRKTESTS